MYIRILKSLSDESRLRIINLLYEGELCVCDIENILKISQPNISRHLANLKNAGLVKDRKQAQWAYYSFNKIPETKFIDELMYKVLRKKDLFENDLINYKKQGGAACQTKG